MKRVMNILTVRYHAVRKDGCKTMDEETKKVISEACERAIAELSADEFSKNTIFFGVSIFVQREVTPDEWMNTEIIVNGDNGAIQDIIRNREMFYADEEREHLNRVIEEAGVIYSSKPWEVDVDGE